VLVEDALFATLDPTVRKASVLGRDFTLVDTVGFVRHLPHQLVEAFRSTLEEVADADLVVHVVDAADEDPDGQIQAVREVLADVDAASVPELIVFNKTDLVPEPVVSRLLATQPGSVAVSARTGAGLDSLATALHAMLPDPGELVDLVVPYTRGDLVARVHESGQVLETEHTGEGTRLRAHVTPELASALRKAAAPNG
jgi:GTP-binding protein HflX